MKKTITWSAIIEIRESKDKEDKVQVAFDYMSNDKGQMIIKTKVLKDDDAENFIQLLDGKQYSERNCAAYVSGSS
jgi:hypothetical protein